MKKYIIVVLSLMMFGVIESQTRGISYQALIINPLDEEAPGFNGKQTPLANKEVCLRFSFIDSFDKVEYQEIQKIKTDEFGMVNLLIGLGKYSAGYIDSFKNINWDGSTKRLKVEVDVKYDCQIFEEISNQILAYVPFAFYALNSPASKIPGPKGDTGLGIKEVKRIQDTLFIKLTNDSIINLGNIKGNKGDQGIQGPIGNTGNNGTDGVSITNAKVESDSLKITLSNGIVINSGYVKGNNGDMGVQGKTGSNGISIMKTEVKKDSLWITLSDSSLQNAGYVKGNKGDTGVSGTNGISVTNSQVINDSLKVTLSNGTIINAGYVKGNTGAQGPQGIQGLTGATGPQGPTGSTGSQGPAGTNGISVTNSQVVNDSLKVTLSNGTIINAGYVKGNTGAQGPQGIQGLIGATGPTGATGSQGPQGNGFQNGTITNQMLYWNGTSWSLLNPGINGQVLAICNGSLGWVTINGICPGLITSFSCNTATHNGTLTTGVSASGVTSTISYTGGNGGAYNSQSISSTGVTGLTATLSSGTFTNGTGNLLYTITGTPSSSGTASFALNIGGQSCILNRIVNLPLGTISSLSCATASDNGSLTVGVSAIGVSSSIPYTGGNGGTYNTQSIISTGVTGLTATLTAGVFTNGTGNLLYTITGTPSSSGTASFALNIGGQSCTLNRTINLPIGTISSLSCGTATNTGTLTVGVLASGVSSSIPYIGGNGGTYNSQSISSTGVTGLTATLSSGTFANGMGNLLYTITGTPSSSGTASFALNIGGQSCTLNWNVLPIGTISSLSCGTVTTTGSLTIGVSASGVSSSISYTGGNGGFYNGEIVTSTGITGLTATLSSGSLSNGNGSVLYIITGMSSTTGTASFLVNLGGQSCSFTVSVGLVATYPAGSVFCTSNATVLIDVMNPTTGRVWMDRNLGASRAPLSNTDIAAYGDLYQWGRRSDGHQCRNSPTTTILSSIDQPLHSNFILGTSGNMDWRSPQNNNLWQGINGINNPCPTGYRLPTETEFNSELASWSPINKSGAFASPLKWLPAGHRNYSNGNVNSSTNFTTASGYYWSSTINGVISKCLQINSASYTNDFNRTYGYSIRCIKN